ncbi:hypothetical protein WR25_16492 [Diploscapter pachys]|uniref:K Homology domain-containing protein n=1 Tax=Diploscapter pachys TaxID=2018661 RepID=A0A2A2KJW6_9BILA|nr:hypothetical protein WR25_16492 [Diploscapter pachys]
MEDVVVGVELEAEEKRDENWEDCTKETGRKSVGWKERMLAEQKDRKVDEMKSVVCSNNNNNNNNKTVEMQSPAPVSVTPKRRLFSIGIGAAAAGMGIDMGLNNNCLSPSPLIHSSLSTAHPVVVPTTPTVRAKSFSGSETKAHQLGSPSRVSAASTDSELALEYMHELTKDQKTLECFPAVFTHLDRLLNEEISRVRSSLFQNEIGIDGGMVDLPEPVGEVMTLTEKLYVPKKEFPDYNFVGRILGPRGMTAKQLEQETGCKIMVRGKGSMRDKKKEEANRGKPEWEHLDDDLHVLLQCEDTENRAKAKLKVATDHVKRLLVPAPEGMDELKRKQLMELAIINGTYRPYHKVGSIPMLATAPSMPSRNNSTTHRGSPSKVQLLSPARQSASPSAHLPVTMSHPPAILTAASCGAIPLTHSPQRPLAPPMPLFRSPIHGHGHGLPSPSPPRISNIPMQPQPALPHNVYRTSSHLFASTPLPSPLPPPNTPVPQLSPGPGMFGNTFFNFGALGNSPQSPPHQQQIDMNPPFTSFFK